VGVALIKGHFFLSVRMLQDSRNYFISTRPFLIPLLRPGRHSIFFFFFYCLIPSLYPRKIRLFCLWCEEEASTEDIVVIHAKFATP
jgi:hypothetical protein